jgi:DNA helicase IV
METTWWTQPEELDEAQQEVVALDSDSDHLVLGPPGSGKTNLLVLRAAYLYGAGYQNIAVLTFGRVLREFLVSGSTNYTFPSNKIKTYVRWGAELLSENGDDAELKGDFREVRAQLLDRLQALACRARPENMFDCILLDKVQDYSVEELSVIRSFARRLFAAGDSKQSIYVAGGSVDGLRKSIGSVKELPYHYRNGIRICRVADGIRGLVDSPDGLEASSNYDETKFPSSVVSRGGLSISEQVAAAIPDITTQLRAYPDGIIGVLCPRNEELDAVWADLSSSALAASVQLQQYAEGYGAFDPDRRVVVATTHARRDWNFGRCTFWEWTKYPDLGGYIATWRTPRSRGRKLRLVSTTMRHCPDI